ncbi:hypothetical protein [Haladaptatus sp. DFWS20]|uniref:hypothetical protein n=1 Tax=Haladaptatus sp. DFWS20 TaxID=3403467 RepID=UPI003EBA9CD4
MMEQTAMFMDALTLMQQTGAEGAGGPALPATGLAALSVGLAALGAGIAERSIGSAAVGALAEDSVSFGVALVMTVLPETMVILALVTLFTV